MLNPSSSDELIPRLAEHHQFKSSEAVMQRALALATAGRGSVEPNPQVGCVIVDDDLRLLGEGFHPFYGGPHAEVVALAAAGSAAAGASLFVTLEPCCHYGKTPPCAEAVIAAGIKRVVIATGDPAAYVAGGGIRRLEQAGIDVTVGLLGAEGEALIAPFRKLQQQKQPWVHAKWAMTLDGKIATRTGASQWISGEQSRQVVHQLRGEMDAIVVGIGTAMFDNPLLTVRPPGPRAPVRVIIDSQARLPLTSKLVQSARETPVLVLATELADEKNVDELIQRGVEVVKLPHQNQLACIPAILDELGQRQMTNILIEGGGTLLGSFFDANAIDEVHAFVAPKLFGGTNALGPVLGTGVALPSQAIQLLSPQIEICGDDLYLHGRVERSTNDAVGAR